MIASGQTQVIGFSGGRVRDQRVGQRRHAGVERAPRGAQRLVGLQHDRELGQVEAADEYQRAGAELGGIRLGMREGVADLAQGHQAKPRRQIERRSQTACSGVFPAACGPGLALSDWDHYNLARVAATRGVAAASKAGAGMAEKRTILVCSCEDTMPLDADAIRRGCRGAQVTTAHQLCRAEIERFRAAPQAARR